MSTLATAAAWAEQDWDRMTHYVGFVPQESPDHAFFSAILATHHNQYDHARKCIAQAHLGVNVEVAATISESYSRAYNALIRVQTLEELEEVITCKSSSVSGTRKSQLQELWNKRLYGCEIKVEVWLRALKIGMLVLPPDKDPATWIRFGTLCKKAQRFGLAERALDSIVNGTGEVTSPHMPWVEYTRLKIAYVKGDREHAFTSLRSLASELASNYDVSPPLIREAPVDKAFVGKGSERDNTISKLTIANLGTMSELLSKCFSRLGKWQINMIRGDWTNSSTQETVQQALTAYSQALIYNSNNHKTWRQFAMSHSELINSAIEQHRAISEQDIRDHVLPAINGFFRSIALPNDNVLQDILRLLKLWFAHGQHHQVDTAITSEFDLVSIDVWLEVVPQLIAHINHTHEKVKHTVCKLITAVSNIHPQALIFPLTVATQSMAKDRAAAATQVLAQLRLHHPVLVDQAELVSSELVRVAMTWHELWLGGLAEAYQCYKLDDMNGMLDALQPLDELIGRAPVTNEETSFVRAYGKDVNLARSLRSEYQHTGNVDDLNRAWDLYLIIYRKLTRLPLPTTLDLAEVSPRLRNAKNLTIAIPGTYRFSHPIVTIRHFERQCNIIGSKQRPRQIAIVGANGKRYSYALKGHEDMRQDERAMQLFGLCNTLLAKDKECSKRQLAIERLAVIPLSNNSGLSGWVTESDTFHTLIKEYRESRGVLLNIEQHIMLNMAPDYANLPLMHKVEVFKHAMDNTTGKDLYRVLWLRSENSEIWLAKRASYTRSMAVMSMVGYVLGLGDRHPSNLLLNRRTGSVVHIDFGDCFEVALNRDMYPERVPFRLTRIVSFATGVSGVEGSFAIACEHTMRVLRVNRVSILAVLEAFVYDPLVHWRLVVPQSATTTTTARAGQLSPPSVPHTSDRPDSTRANWPGNNHDSPSTKEEYNERALQVFGRVKQKLQGMDLRDNDEVQPVAQQVKMLVAQATSIENLCQHYDGWCSFW